MIAAADQNARKPIAVVTERAHLSRPGLGQSNRAGAYDSDTMDDEDEREVAEWWRADVLVRARNILNKHVEWLYELHPTQADSAVVRDADTDRVYVVLANQTETLAVFRFLPRGNRLRRLKRWPAFIAEPSSVDASYRWKETHRHFMGHPLQQPERDR
jgi:hypothetical protein